MQQKKKKKRKKEEKKPRKMSQIRKKKGPTTSDKVQVVDQVESHDEEDCEVIDATQSSSPSEDKKESIRFNEELDVLLLQQVLADQPHLSSYGQKSQKWQEVADKLNTSTKFKPRGVTKKGLVARFDHLKKTHKTDESSSKRASGTKENYTQKQKLLNQLIELENDASQKKEKLSEKEEKKKIEK